MKLWPIACALLLFAAPLIAADAPAATPVQRQNDVIYGRLPGIALTMDVFSPGKDAKVMANGAGVLWLVSGGWASAHESIDNKFMDKTLAELVIYPLVERGYTVFAVVHASQPKYTIPEILPQINRAVRFIRFNGKQFGVDGNRLGIVGASAGGHLSLMQGLSPEATNEKAPDPVDKVSSRVQAVAAFVPPTDFLNYGGPGLHALGSGALGWLRAPFDFTEVHTVTSALFPGATQTVYERVTDLRQIEDIGRRISPIYQIDKDDPPVFVLHGEVDSLVPLQQAQSLKAKLDEAKVPNELFIRPKANHAWPEMGQDMQKVADWFDKYLSGTATTVPSEPDAKSEKK